MNNDELPITVKQILGFDLIINFQINLNPFRWKFLCGKYFLPFKFEKNEGVENNLSVPVRSEELTIYLLPIQILLAKMTPPTRKEYNEASVQQINWQVEMKKRQAETDLEMEKKKRELELRFIEIINKHVSLGGHPIEQEKNIVKSVFEMSQFVDKNYFPKQIGGAPVFYTIQ